MSGYTPVYSSMYDGTLHGKWPTAAVWASLLPLLNVRGELNLTYEAIAARTGWPMDLLRKGIEALMQPDPDSQSKAEEGRRLVLLDPARTWGWRAVNHSAYREKARKQNSDQRRVESGGNAERMRERRQATSGHSIEGRPAPTRADPPSYSYSDTDTSKEKNIYTHADDSAQTKRPEGLAQRKAPKPEQTRKRKRERAPEPGYLTELRAAYPRRAGAQPWRRAIGCINARLQEGDSLAEIIEGAKRYAAFCEATGKLATEYVMQITTFVGPERHYAQAWTLPAMPAAKETPEQTSLRRLTERRAAIGLADFRAPFPNETSKAYASAQDEEWHRRRDAKARNGSARGPIETSVKTAADMSAALRPMERG